MSSLMITQAECKSKLTGLTDELKHIDKEIKKDAPALAKVRSLSPPM